MRGEKDRPSVRRRLPDGLMDLLLDEWVETRRRFIEDEQLGSPINACTIPTFCRLPLESDRIGRSSSSSNRSARNATVAQEGPPLR